MSTATYIFSMAAGCASLLQRCQYLTSYSPHIILRQQRFTEVTQLVHKKKDVICHNSPHCQRKHDRV